MDCYGASTVVPKLFRLVTPLTYWPLAKAPQYDTGGEGREGRGKDEGILGWFGSALWHHGAQFGNHRTNR